MRRTASIETCAAVKRAVWAIPPATGWHRKTLHLVSSRLFAPVFTLALVIALLGLINYWRLGFPTLLLTGIHVIALATLIWLVVAIQRELYTPLAHLRHWALRMRSGNLRARVPVAEQGESSELSRDINELSETLQALSEEMDAQVRKQTERIEQKKQSLKILYQVAASINAARDLDDLLSRFLTILTEVTHARAGTVRLLTDDNEHMRLVATHGLNDSFITQEQLIPVKRCLCGSAITGGSVASNADTHNCEKHLNGPLFDSDNTEIIAIPLEYRGKKLGLYNLFVDGPGLMEREDIPNLLTSIGQHLGMAIDKIRLDTEARRLSIIEERTLLAHELHDSLAQSMASLRFQASALEDGLRQHSVISSTELHRLRDGIEEANFELRELMAHFRAPVNERGLMPSLEAIIVKFRRTTGISVFLQNEYQHAALPATIELQVLRIVQEALCNIRKHSRARAVRIRLRYRPENQYQLMIEDDGIGINQGDSIRGASAGEHIGLSVMRERSERLGGRLSIDSDPGEGTRLELSFHYPQEQDEWVHVAGSAL